MSGKKETPSSGGRYVEVPIKSAIPLWTAAAVWIVAALFFPMARIINWVITAFVSIAAGRLAAKMVPKETKRVEVPFSSGDEMLDAMVAEMNRAAEDICGAREKLGGKRETAAEYMKKICDWITAIRDEIIAKPDKLSLVRRFMNYYLPTAVKISLQFSETAGKTEGGSNLRTALDAMEEALYRIEDAFRRQYDALFADDVLDVTTDIEVLEQMLERDHLK